MKTESCKTIWNFVRDRKGSVSIPMTIAIIPIIAATGAAVDFGRGLIMAGKVQSAVDQAALTAANLTGSDTVKKAKADDLLAAALMGTPAATNFVTNADTSVTYNATVTMATMFTPFIVPSITIRRQATAMATVAGTPGVQGVAGWSDTSCILTLGEDLQLDSDNIMTWNGSPSVQLTGCSLRSNRSMKCNG